MAVSFSSEQVRHLASTLDEVSSVLSSGAITTAIEDTHQKFVDGKVTPDWSKRLDSATTQSIETSDNIKETLLEDIHAMSDKVTQLKNAILQLVAVHSDLDEVTKSAIGAGDPVSFSDISALP